MGMEGRAGITTTVTHGRTEHMSKTYVTRTGVTQYRSSMAEVEDMMADQTGFCLACGASDQMAEPDARKYTCEACGKAKVYGAEELVVMGLAY